MPIMVAALAAVTLLLASSGTAQLACTPYVSSDTPQQVEAGQPGPLFNTISVPDAFPLADVSVANITILHNKVGALKVSLLSGGVAVVLKDVLAGGSGQDMNQTGVSDSASVAFPSDSFGEPFTGVYLPQQPLSVAFANSSSSTLPQTGVLSGSGGSQGNWTLRVVDLGENRLTRSISLQSWTLVLCTGNASASSAPVNRPIIQEPFESLNATAGAVSSDNSTLFPPVDDLPNYPPIDNSTALLPSAESATTPYPSADNSTTYSAADNSTTVPTADNSTLLAPPGDTALIPPASDSSTYPSTDNSTVLPPLETGNSTFLLPANETTSATAPSNVTLVPPVTNGTNSSSSGAPAVASASGPSDNGADLPRLETDAAVRSSPPPAGAGTAALPLLDILGGLNRLGGDSTGALSGAATPPAAGTASTSTGLFDRLVAGLDGSPLGTFIGGVGGSPSAASTRSASNDTTAAGAPSGFTLQALLGRGPITANSSTAAQPARTQINSSSISGGGALGGLPGGLFSTLLPNVAAAAGAEDGEAATATPIMTNLQEALSNAIPAALDPFVQRAQTFTNQYLNQAQQLGRNIGALLPGGTPGSRVRDALGGAATPAAGDTGEPATLAGVRRDYLRASVQQQSALAATQSEVYRNAVEAAVANYQGAIDSATALVTRYLTDFSTAIQAEVSRIQEAIQSIVAQTQQAGASLSSTARQALQDLLSGASTLRFNSQAMSSDLGSAFDSLLGAYRSQVQAAQDIRANVTGNRASVAQSAAEQSLNSLNDVLKRVNTALEQYASNAGPLVGGNLQRYSKGLDFLQSSIQDLQSQVADLPAGSLSISAQAALDQVLNSGGTFIKLYQKARQP